MADKKHDTPQAKRVSPLARTEKPASALDGSGGTPMREAVALEYDKNSPGAPKIIAQGKGAVADRIIEKALENKVPIHKDPDLAHTLNLLTIGEEIPPELYQVVAKILLFVSDMDKLSGKRRR